MAFAIRRAVINKSISQNIETEQTTGQEQNGQKGQEMQEGRQDRIRTKDQNDREGHEVGKEVQDKLQLRYTSQNCSLQLFSNLD